MAWSCLRTYVGDSQLRELCWASQDVVGAGLDFIETAIHGTELLPQPLDVTVDSAVINNYMIVIGCSH